MIRPFKKISAILILAMVVITAGLGWLQGLGLALSSWTLFYLERANIFVSVFLGIFIEAVPFLLLGTLASGTVAILLDEDFLTKIFHRKGFTSVLLGSLMGLIFPVCECGVVPLVRRLIRKGLPVPSGIAFLLAAPVLNPIVIASTYTAFGPGILFWGRLGLSLSVAIITGLIFSMNSHPENLLNGSIDESVMVCTDVCTEHKNTSRLKSIFVIAGDEFFEMGRYLVIGSAAAALMQAIIPQSLFLSTGQAGIFSNFLMAITAVILSVCSTVDSFIALTFVGTFSSASILTFLVFGPMVDIKSTLLFLQVFQKKTVFYLILLPLLLTLIGTMILQILVR